MASDPTQRPTAKEVLATPILQPIIKALAEEGKDKRAANRQNISSDARNLFKNMMSSDQILHPTDKEEK